MKKVKTLFVRDWVHNPDLVTTTVEPSLEFVVQGGAVPTRKWDGTCCLVKDGKLYKRHDRKRRKKGNIVGEWKEAPPGWIPCEQDEKTGHWWGWALVDFDKPENWMHAEAVLNTFDGCSITKSMLNETPIRLIPGTWELCGPKINGNPEQFDKHVLVPHGMETLDFSFKGGDPHDELKSWLADKDIEGIVWWKHDEPVAKIKKCDFGLPRVGSK